MAAPHRFIVESLAATGFAIVAPHIAFELHPDFFGSWQDALVSLAEPEITPTGCKRVMAEIDSHPVLVLARSTDRLAERLGWITGRAIGAIADAPPRQARVRKQKFSHSPVDLAAQRRERMLRLAKEDPPAHDCPLRREILAARAEFGGDHGRA